METTINLVGVKPKSPTTPYSLGKLVEWKLGSWGSPKIFYTPYSLGKLVEWKLLIKADASLLDRKVSLLAREIS